MTSTRISPPQSILSFTVQRKYVKLILQQELQSDYKIEWSLVKELSPLRIKPRETKKAKLKVIIEKWVKSICGAANVKAIQADGYMMINFLSNDRTTYASVWGNGTVMFQGKNCEQWLQDNVNDIVNNIKDDSKKVTKNKSSPSTEQSTCTICNEKYTDDMVQCKVCNIWIHYDCDTDTILDNESEHKSLSMYMCPTCRASPRKETDHSIKNRDTSNRIPTRTTRSTVKVSQTTSKNEVSEASLNETFIVNTASNQYNKSANDSVETCEKSSGTISSNNKNQDNNALEESLSALSDGESNWMDDDDLCGTNCSLEVEVTHDVSSVWNTTFTPIPEIDELSSDMDSADDISVIEVGSTINKVADVIKKKEDDEDTSLQLSKCINTNPDYYALNPIQMYDESIHQIDGTSQPHQTSTQSLPMCNTEEQVNHPQITDIPHHVTLQVDENKDQNTSDTYSKVTTDTEEEERQTTAMITSITINNSQIRTEQGTRNKLINNQTPTSPTQVIRETNCTSLHANNDDDNEDDVDDDHEEDDKDEDEDDKDEEDDEDEENEVTREP